jgi:hypothetical protein
VETVIFGRSTTTIAILATGKKRCFCFASNTCEQYTTKQRLCGMATWGVVALLRNRPKPILCSGYRVIKNRPPRHDPYRRYWYGVPPVILEQPPTKLVMMVPHNVEYRDKNGTVSTLSTLMSIGGRFVAADQLTLVPLLVLLNTVLFWNI